MSADWVACLARGLAGRARVVNAGVSGATAPEVAGAVPALLTAYPDVAVGQRERKRKMGGMR